MKARTPAWLLAVSVATAGTVLADVFGYVDHQHGNGIVSIDSATRGAARVNGGRE
jgi:hypothetical protein